MSPQTAANWFTGKVVPQVQQDGVMQLIVYWQTLRRADAAAGIYFTQIMCLDTAEQDPMCNIMAHVFSHRTQAGDILGFMLSFPRNVGYCICMKFLN